MAKFKIPEWHRVRAGLKSGARQLLGTFYRAVTVFRENKVQFQANALAYRTLLNLVPMLAFMLGFFTLFQGILGKEDIEEVLKKAVFKYLLPNSELAQSILSRIDELLKSAKAASYVALFLLFWTSIFLFAAIEDSINTVFKVQRRRSFPQRVVLFTAILVWAPLLVGLSIYLTAFVQFQTILDRINASQVPLLVPLQGFLQSLVFTTEYITTYSISFGLIFLGMLFLFKIFPNTYVENGAAALGAFFSALFWEISKWGFSYFAAAMAHSRQFIWAGFAVFLVFLIWMYLTWIIVLFGAQLAYIFQHYRYELKTTPLRKRKINRLWLGCEVMLEMGIRFLKGEQPVCVRDLASRFSVGLPELSGVLDALEGSRLIAKVAEDNKRTYDICYQPARELDHIFLNQMVAAVDPDWNLERPEHLADHNLKLRAEDQFIARLFQNLKAEFDQSLSQRSLKQILVEEILVSERERGHKHDG